MFLRRSPLDVERGRPLWKLQDSQAVLFVTGNKLTPTSKDKALSKEIGDWTLAEFKERVEQAEARGERGEVKPVPD